RRQEDKEKEEPFRPSGGSAGSAPRADTVTRNASSLVSLSPCLLVSLSSSSMARRKHSTAPENQATWSISISALLALSSHISDSGRTAATTRPPRRPRWRWKYQKNSRTVAVAARAEGSRAVHSVTPPNSQPISAMAAYMPGGFVNSGSPYSVGTTQLPLRRNSAPMIARTLPLPHTPPP